MQGLTNKQERFAQLVVLLDNKSEAYAQAYDTENTARNTIGARAHELSIIPKVASRIQELRYQVQQQFGVDAQRVLGELAAIAFSGIQDIAHVDSEGQVKVKDFSGIPRHVLAGISQIKPVNNGLEVRMHDKVAAIKLLGQHLGLFDKKVKHTHEGGFVVQVQHELRDKMRGYSLDELKALMAGEVVEAEHVKVLDDVNSESLTSDPKSVISNDEPAQVADDE